MIPFGIDDSTIEEMKKYPEFHEGVEIGLHIQKCNVCQKKLDGFLLSLKDCEFYEDKDK